MKKKVIFFISLGLFCVIGISLLLFQLSQSNARLTTQFLEGVWVNEEGFVCEYTDNQLIDSKGCSYKQCEVRDDSVKGFYAENESNSILIEVIDDEVIKIDDTTAYRADSAKGEECIESVKEAILGYWKYEMNHQIHTVCITEDKIELMLIIDATYGQIYKRDIGKENDENSQDIAFDGLKLMAHGEQDTYCSYLQLKNGYLQLSSDEVTTYLEPAPDFEMQENTNTQSVQDNPDSQTTQDELNEENESNTKSDFTYQPYVIPVQVRKFIGEEHIPDLVAVLETLYAGESEVKLTTIQKSSEWDKLRRAVQTLFIPRDLLYDYSYHIGDGPFAYNESTQTIHIKYEYEDEENAIYTHSKEEYLSLVNQFEELIESVFHSYVTDLTNQEQTAKELYQYVSDATVYELDKTLSSYQGFVQHTAYCQTYSQMYQYLLWQAGIECYLTGSCSIPIEEGMASHEWNIISLNGNYYNVDVTWQDSTMEQYYYFGMSDERCRETGHGDVAEYFRPSDAILDYMGSQYNITCTDTTYDEKWK